MPYRLVEPVFRRHFDLFSQSYFPPAGFSGAVAYSINNSGQVAGYATGPDGRTIQAFIGTSAGSSALKMPTGRSSTAAYGLNNSGQVAGVGYRMDATAAPFIGSSENSTALPLPGGFNTAYGYGINSSGQVSGYGYFTNGMPQPFVGNSTRSTVIPLPAGWFSGYGYGINDSGQVAGSGYNSENSTIQAFIGSSVGSNPIPLPPDGRKPTVLASIIPDWLRDMVFSPTGLPAELSLEPSPEAHLFRCLPAG